ncbi:methyltransferase domain-containing protein [Parahaliea maris]|uniref:Methyltransferase domain-containing protein n=1 Tax=Parahaliea maris TaxID=2716870 RepID=A0A5C8ZSL7_9GAMM|nr:methyltransferase domain-containing protein [Parahaliea maris]TXS90754.1 methyltransferase domain-containing protein [Parahaliea maris]
MSAESLQLAWRCPSCQSPLAASERQWLCENNHCFDISRQGHVNLLLAHHKRSKNPGDAKAMLQARRRFLQRGFYQPLARAMAELIGEQAAPGASSRTLLDAGCGEGYYLRELDEQLPGSWHFGGFDIAKDAVLMAAKSNRQHEYVCASSKNIPLEDASVDVVVSVFSPLQFDEIERIVRPGGALLVVGPGPGHLLEIKRAIYSEVRSYAETKSPESFESMASKSLEYSAGIHDSEAWQDVLAMTPFAHHGSAAAKTELLASPPPLLTCDFTLALYRKPGDEK